MPEDRGLVEQMFRGRGAYGRFKGLLERKGELEEWHEFERSAVATELVLWAEEEGFVVERE